VSRGVADGAPLVKCQLLASAFYEALRHELRKADASKRITLLAVTDQCHRSAAANISPVQALAELKRAIDLLQPVIPAVASVAVLFKIRRTGIGRLRSSGQRWGTRSPGIRSRCGRLRPVTAACLQG
jgi:hypothetical protein